MPPTPTCRYQENRTVTHNMHVHVQRVHDKDAPVTRAHTHTCKVALEGFQAIKLEHESCASDCAILEDQVTALRTEAAEVWVSVHPCLYAHCGGGRAHCLHCYGKTTLRYGISAAAMARLACDMHCARVASCVLRACACAFGYRRPLR